MSAEQGNRAGNQRQPEMSTPDRPLRHVPTPNRPPFAAHPATGKHPKRKNFLLLFLEKKKVSPPA
jgi:hypothetical protein